MADNPNQIGDRPIEPKFAENMRAIGQTIDYVFNRGEERTVGFVLMVFDLGTADGRCNYISNAVREDIIVLLKEQLARFQGMPEAKGHD